MATGREFEDSGWALADPQCKEPSLIRARYAKKQIEVKPAEWGLYRYADWIPVAGSSKGSSAPVTYRSRGLASTSDSKTSGSPSTATIPPSGPR